ncbi:hypothetical protein OEZ86_006957 [Tetradesmus obliquus]|nr:hypothetical protein OEZ86_006957 [Tetradesmus obliquus]
MATEPNEGPRSAPYSALEHIMCQLPVQQRMGNCSLACRSLQEAAVAVTGTVQLTSLQLSTFSTCSPTATVRWTARQIVPLTSLRCLNLGFSGFGPHTYTSSGAPSADLSAALGQLVQLTALSLDSHLDGTALSTVSSLTQLQRLQLIDVGRVGSSEEPLKVQGFPSSLTHLRLLGCCIQAPDDGSSWRLPLLQELDMWDVQGFELAAIADTPQLRWELSLVWPKDSSDARVAGNDVLLLLQLKRLTSLSVGGPLWDNRAATEVLARLTGLQELYVVGSTELSLLGVRQLTRLTALTTLCLSKCGMAFLCDMAGHDPPLSLTSQASPPDVWRQLQHKCDQMAAMQRW